MEGLTDVEETGATIEGMTGEVRGISTRRGIWTEIGTETETEIGIVEEIEIVGIDLGSGEETGIRESATVSGAEMEIETEAEETGATEQRMCEQADATATMQIEAAAARETGRAATIRCAQGSRIRAGEEETNT
jgi:hypothetical protein